jgi:hypothetical protein
VGYTHLRSDFTRGDSTFPLAVSIAELVFLYVTHDLICPCYDTTYADTQLNEARGFYVSTDNIFDETTWSDPIYFDSLGIDQDVSFASTSV